MADAKTPQTDVDEMESTMIDMWNGLGESSKAGVIQKVKEQCQAVSPKDTIDLVLIMGIDNSIPDPFEALIKRIAQPNWRGLSDYARVAVAKYSYNTALGALAEMKAYRMGEMVKEAVGLAGVRICSNVNCGDPFCPNKKRGVVHNMTDCKVKDCTYCAYGDPAEKAKVAAAAAKSVAEDTASSAAPSNKS